jgi:hypothetical protein
MHNCQVKRQRSYTGTDHQSVGTRYREGLDLVLKNISLSIKPHEKIGVVGRTGAGKSSLTLALFRIIEPVEGNISIDDLNTSSIGLLDLRRRLAIIPQDAALFEGTIRDNLDPGGIHDDTELWSVLGKSSPIISAIYQHILCAALIALPAFSAYALQLPLLTPDSTEHARLKDHVASMSGGLEAKVHEGGMSNFHTVLQIISLITTSFTCATSSTSSTNPDSHPPECCLSIGLLSNPESSHYLIRTRPQVNCGLSDLPFDHHHPPIFPLLIHHSRFQPFSRATSTRLHRPRAPHTLQRSRP